MDEQLLRLIRNSYRKCYTEIKSASGATKKIWLRKRVKQGDPLSPLLFNMSIDPLLHTLDRLGLVFIVKGSDVKSLAFADDLVLLSVTWGGMCNNLALLDKFSHITGIQVNPKKCHRFSICRNKHGQQITNECATWKIIRTDIHMIDADKSSVGDPQAPTTGHVAEHN